MELLHEIFGNELPSLSPREREIAERVLNWLWAYPTTIEERDSPEIVRKITEAANLTMRQLYGMTFQDTLRYGRKRPYVDYRRWCMIAMEDYSRLTQEQIAKIIGRDRTLIYSSRRVVGNICEYDKAYRAEYQKFTDTFKKNLLCVNI